MQAGSTGIYQVQRANEMQLIQLITAAILQYCSAATVTTNPAIASIDCTCYQLGVFFPSQLLTANSNPLIVGHSYHLCQQHIAVLSFCIFGHRFNTAISKAELSHITPFNIEPKVGHNRYTIPHRTGCVKGQFFL